MGNFPTLLSLRRLSVRPHDIVTQPIARAFDSALMPLTAIELLPADPSTSSTASPPRLALSRDSPRLALVSSSTLRPKPRAPVAPVWEPVPRLPGAIPTTSEVLHGSRSPEDLEPAIEAAIVQTLTRPLAPGEGHQMGNANRERELLELLANLDVIESHHLGRRLDLDRPSDPLAQAFRRLTVDRRGRLRAFIADARRRQMRRSA